MATLNLGTFDTGSVTLNELNDGLATEWAYQAEINGVPNPETKAQFNKRQIGRIMREAYRSGKRRALIQAAEESVPDVIIT